MSFQEIFSGQIITNNTIKPDTPQFSKTNPLKSDVFVNGIELILSAEFSEKGAILILIDGHTKFNSVGTNSIKGYSKFPIPLKQPIQRDVKVEIFAWNKVDSNSIECNLNLSMSKDPQPFNSQAVPLSIDLLNSVLNEGEVLFVLQPRKDQTNTQLIDMQGNKKLRVFMSGADYVPPTVTYGGAGVADGNLSSRGTGFSVAFGAGEIKLGEIDFGSIANRNVKGRVEGITLSGNYFTRLYYSVNGVDWILREQKSQNNGAQIIDIGGLGNVSCRYLKVTCERDPASGGGSNTFHCLELYDANLFGGTSALSFEQLNISTNLWQTVIPATEFGTLSQGQEVTAEIGDVNTVSISGKTYALPSTQTQFRAKLITTGGITNGISITKMK